MNSFSKLCCSFLFFASYFSDAALIQIETSGNAKFQLTSTPIMAKIFTMDMTLENFDLNHSM